MKGCPVTYRGGPPRLCVIHQAEAADIEDYRESRELMGAASAALAATDPALRSGWTDVPADADHPRTASPRWFPLPDSDPGDDGE